MAKIPLEFDHCKSVPPKAEKNLEKLLYKLAEDKTCQSLFYTYY